jgi:ferrous iron transport protein A
MRLSTLQQGQKAIITGLCAGEGHEACVLDAELERRLLELGFQEGVKVEVLHQGHHRPMAVQIADFTIALRHAEADAVEVEPLSS